MRTLGNILWHIPFLGFIVALENFIIGGLFTITVWFYPGYSNHNINCSAVYFNNRNTGCFGIS